MASKAEKTKRWREQNVEKVQEYYRKKTEKKKAFDALNPEAAREVRKKKAAIRKEQRRKKKIRNEQEEMEKENRPVEKTNDSDKAAPEVNSVPENVIQKVSRQKAVGIKRKRQNDQKRKDEMDRKEKQLKEGESTAKQQGKEIQELKLKSLEQEAKLGKLLLEKRDMLEKQERDEKWISTVYKRMPKTGRVLFKDSLLASREDLPKGTLLKARNLLGVNFHKALTAKEKEEPRLSKLVKDFAERNSDEVPYTKTCTNDINRPNKRLALHFKVVLYECFVSEYPDEKCSYSTFCVYWPKHIVRPNLDNRGTCKCEVCENSLMVQQGLKKHKLLEQDDDIFLSLRAAREGDDEEFEKLEETLSDIQEGERRDEVVTFKRWVQVPVVSGAGDEGDIRQRGKPKTVPERRTQQVTARRLSEIALADFNDLKEHLARNAKIKQYIGQKKKEVEGSTEGVLLHVDWSECGTFHQPGETQGAFFNRKCYSIHTGYKYSKTEPFGFAAVSSYTDHKAESHFTALRSLLNDLLGQGFTHFYFVSDSPVTQYRNQKNVWLISEWCKQYKCRAEWIFTERSHGKSAADGIGGGLKNLHKSLLAHDTSLTINTVEELVRVVGPHTSTKLSIFSKEMVEELRSFMPSKLNSLHRAFQLHHLVFSEEGRVTSSMLPGERGQEVVIRPTWRARQDRTVTPLLTVHPEQEQEGEEGFTE